MKEEMISELSHGSLQHRSCFSKPIDPAGLKVCYTPHFLLVELATY